MAWARASLLSIAKANAARLEAGGSVAMARYLTSATQQPKLTASLKRLLVSLPRLTIGAWILDSSDPPQQRLLSLELPKEVTVAGALQAIFEQQKDGSLGVGIQDFSAQPKPSDYLLKICCSQVDLIISS